MSKNKRTASSLPARLVKYFFSHVEFLKLKYYKRNPLEKKAFDVVAQTYREEQGTLISILFFGKEPSLFWPGELLNIYEHARVMSDHGGAFAEVGVFRGASAKVISEAKSETPLYLFDTFDGLPDTFDKTDSRFKQGMFTAEQQTVADRLSKYSSIKIYPGFFPDTAGPITDKKFSFVHLDVDLYECIKQGLEFFYPRMLPGGRIIVDDYGHCEGVWLACDEFIANKPEKLQPMETKQVLLIKK